MTELLPVVTRVATLHRVDLFAGIPGRLLVAVAAMSEEVRVQAGSTVIEEGAVEDHLFVVVEGRVRVHRGDQTLVELGPGAIVGELAVLVPEPRSATVTALDATHLLKVRKPVLDELLLDWPELANGVIASLVAKLRAAAAPSGPHEGG